MKARVAKVLSSDEIVLNKGTFDGVDEGMVFRIRDERLDDIIDPETGESLGSIDSEKGWIRITRIGDRASLGVLFDPSSVSARMGVMPYVRGILSSRDDDIRVGDVADSDY
jgi:hypothetical protein